MRLEFKYAGSSGIVSDPSRSRVAFATNQLREATYFDGELARPLVFREALGALYDVVVSDYRYHPKDRLAFRAWLEQQDRKFLDSLVQGSPEVMKRIEALEARLAELDAAREAAKRPFYAARRRYIDYLYAHQYELDYILDPVITVHPDELSFEAFSRDESVYARLSARYDLFGRIDAAEHGTTNVDFGIALRDQLDRMRSYRATRFTVDASGFAVAQGASVVKEKKIELPESWVKGFLQVHAVMSMGLTHLRLSPIDLFNVCRFLRRHRARKSPRALRWELSPGKPVRIVFEPWERSLVLSPPSTYEGAKEKVVRTWGRDRLQVLERVIPVSERIDVFLAGTGLPSVFVCDLGDLVFTLALSGWTDNDWTGGTTKLDLLNETAQVGRAELTRAYETLRSARYATDTALASEAGLSVEQARSALSLLCRAGRAMKDLASGVYRHRDLWLEPFDAERALAISKAEAEDADPKAKAAKQIFEAGDVRIIARRPVSTGYKISGSAKGADGARVRPLIAVDAHGRIVEASCTCSFGRKHGLTKGPCEHMLALRLAHVQKLDEETH
ncbi:MAG TPA: SWIM zinc finger family protein [Sandaracinaceae bacterium]